MDDKEILSGGFFTDEEGTVEVMPDDTAKSLIEQMHSAYTKKNDIIMQALADGLITPEYAGLLNSMHTSSFSGEIATLEKVDAALSLRNELQPTFQTGRVAYLASAVDWQFPVALGARRIDMVDLSFSDPAYQEELLRSIQQSNPHATLVKDAIPSITFGMDLGKGLEVISLRLIGQDITQYDPPEALAGVIEFAGPTKGISPELPVVDNVAKRLRPAGQR